MAITVTHNAVSKGTNVWPADMRISLGEIAGPASYTTNGFTADAPTDFEVEVAQISGAQVTSDAGYTATFNADYNKIVVYASAGTEVTAATDLSGVNFTVVLYTADAA